MRLAPSVASHHTFTESSTIWLRPCTAAQGADVDCRLKTTQAGAGRFAATSRRWVGRKAGKEALIGRVVGQDARLITS